MRLRVSWSKYNLADYSSAVQNCSPGEFSLREPARVSNIDQTITAERIYLFIEFVRRTPSMHRFFQVALLGAALMATVATGPSALKADDDHPTRYHDRERNDDHEWNNREDRAYQKWLDEKHHAKREFAKLKNKEQREYWKWRHEHPDKD
jgi:hypothetical protein